MFSMSFKDSFSEGVIYPGRAIMALGLIVALTALLSYI
jgi:hypothetical protein